MKDIIAAELDKRLEEAMFLALQRLPPDARRVEQSVAMARARADYWMRICARRNRPEASSA